MQLLRALLWFSIATVACAATETDTFSYNSTSFLLNGTPFQIRGGQMDPQRVPRPYWKNRLAMAQGMGLNTIFSYPFWNELQPSPDTFDFSGINDLAEFYHEVNQAGMKAVLRLGPYVCGEHDWGGLPAWLSEVPGMAVRQNNKPFLDAVAVYVKRMAQELGPLLIKEGGPVVMVQIENEYGSCGTDHEYTNALKDIFQANFLDVVLYTNDGGGQGYLEGGQVPGILAEVDGSPQVGFPARTKYADASSQGPLLDGEYYTTWFDGWGSGNGHSQSTGSQITSIQKDIDWILSGNNSFSLYMFHGGTNWGFQSGSVQDDPLEPVTTSYDYGAPLDEAGQVTDLYKSLRQTISSHLQPGEQMPPIPKANQLISIPSFTLSPAASLFENLPNPLRKPYPVNMESLQQAKGFILYRTKINAAVQGVLSPGDKPRDRVLVYVNSHRVGVIDGTYKTPKTVTVQLHANDTLDLLVENLGRDDFHCPMMFDQRKGIVGNVTVGNTVLTNWEMYPLSLDNIPSARANSGHSKAVPDDSQAPPIFYDGSFDLQTVGDTFLELPGWIKGVVWVNGVNLGRYWIVGPQQSLYLPGCYLNQGSNKVTVLALSPNSTATTVHGAASRTWANHPDPDAS